MSPFSIMDSRHLYQSGPPLIFIDSTLDKTVLCVLFHYSNRLTCLLSNTLTHPHSCPEASLPLDLMPHGKTTVAGFQSVRLVALHLRYLVGHSKFDPSTLINSVERPGRTTHLV